MKLSKIIHFFYRKEGSVSIEASIIFGLLILLIVLVAEFGMALINQSKLERLSYSLASLIRESSLYENSSDDLSQKASGLYKIFQNLSKDILPKDSELALKLEVLYFSPPTSADSTPKVSQSLHYDFGDFSCEASSDLEDNARLSVQTSQKRFVPLYRVTTCIRQKNNLMPINGVIEKFIPIQASSITLGR